MAASMNAVQMAAKLYDMRETAKVLCGARYQSRMAQLGEYISSIAAKENKSAIVVAMNICNAAGLEGMDVIVLMAAAVELSEPMQ